MRTKKAKGKRRGNRVSRDDVKSNLTRGGGGANWLRLPRGVETWKPERKDTYSISILPYITTSDKHPDGVSAGTVWYKFPFGVHYGIGPDNASVVCPTSIGKKCPICERKNRLVKAGYEENKKAIQALSPRRMVAYNIEHPDESDQVAVMVLSRGNFQAPLEDELLQNNDENVLFFDDGEDGRIIRTRFSQDTFMGKKFLKATRFDFKPRVPLSEEIFDQTIVLDDALIVPEYDALKKMFLETDDDDDSDDDDDDESDDEGEDDSDESDDDDDSDDESDDEDEDDSDESDDEDDDESDDDESDDDESEEDEDDSDESDDNDDSDDDDESDDEDEDDADADDDDSDDDESDDDDDEEEQEKPKRGPGRPKGSKNVPKKPAKPSPKRGPRRPKGSTNKRK